MPKFIAISPTKAVNADHVNLVGLTADRKGVFYTLTGCDTGLFIQDPN